MLKTPLSFDREILISIGVGLSLLLSGILVFVIVTKTLIGIYGYQAPAITQNPIDSQVLNQAIDVLSKTSR